MAIQKCMLLGAVLILVFATAFTSPAVSETLTVDCTKGETIDLCDILVIIKRSSFHSLAFFFYSSELAV